MMMLEVVYGNCQYIVLPTVVKPVYRQDVGVLLVKQRIGNVLLF